MMRCTLFGLVAVVISLVHPALWANDIADQVPEPPIGPAAEPATKSVVEMMRQPVGENLPDTILTDDTGREVRFFTDLVKDHAVVISFFYTNCRGTCPGTNIVLSDVRDELASDFGKSVRFIAISIEPEKDDVTAISEYAAQYRAEVVDPDMPEWVFLTGKPDEIRALRYKLGYYNIDPVADADPTQHAATVIIGNHATGRWGMMPVGIGAELLSAKVRRLAGWTKAQRYGDVYTALAKNREAAGAGSGIETPRP